MEKEKIAELIEQELMDSHEVIKHLGISRARLSQLIKAQKLLPVKKNIFLKKDVLKRKEEQVFLRDKYYHTPSKKE